ncbi:MAG: putative oxidoreductase protein [Moraxellaceae bacterium]|jgi:NADPH2:quinone reductase|nr:putative oxidoreductase protein [Moraxellaceae bacterium]
MKAVLCKQHGLPETLVVEDVPSPVPGPKQVLISVKACGVNFPDTLIIQNLYQFKPALPFSPGGELAGVVKAVGEGVKHVQPGQPVLAFTGWGGFAEEVLADAKQVVPLPPGLDMAVAAAFMMTYGTSYHALKDRAQLQGGETLLVLGAAGGVGLAAIELGKKLGARVIAAASTAEKLAVCREHGADELINYEGEDLRERLKEITDGKGVDVIYDPVGGKYAELALRGIGWKGRYLVVGFAAGDIPKIPLNLPLLKGCAILGVFWGDFAAREPQANMANGMQLFQWLMQGELKPHISARYPLEQAPEALRALMERRVTGKVVLVP